MTHKNVTCLNAFSKLLRLSVTTQRTLFWIYTSLRTLKMTSARTSYVLLPFTLRMAIAKERRSKAGVGK